MQVRALVSSFVALAMSGALVLACGDDDDSGSNVTPDGGTQTPDSGTSPGTDSGTGSTTLRRARSGAIGSMGVCIPTCPRWVRAVSRSLLGCSPISDERVPRAAARESRSASMSISCVDSSSMPTERKSIAAVPR